MITRSSTSLCRDRRPGRDLFRRLVLGASATAIVAFASTARADPPLSVSNPGLALQKVTQPDTLTPEGDPTFTTGLFASSRATLLGDAGGIRSFLGRYGITLSLNEMSEVFGNASGGLRQSAYYDGLTTATLQLDTLRAFGLVGGTFNASALQIHGSNLSAKNLLVLQTLTGVEGNRSTRLWELWYEQSLLNGAVDVKIGQQSLDLEFYVSPSSGLFINSAMGWPFLPSIDQYAGGPAYPLSSLGVRFRVPVPVLPSTTALFGVFDDNPAGGPFNDDSQTRGSAASGTRFNLKTGALVYGELQYTINQPATGDLATEENTGLPGLYKLGFWYDSGAFPNQRYAIDGGLLGNPAGSGIPAMDRGNYSFYGVFDQTIYRPNAYEPRAVSIFARVMGAPDDRNLISFSVNAGVTLKAPFEGRDNDIVGLGIGYGRVSQGAIASQYAAAAFAGPSVFSPISSSETFIEATYQYQLAAWWQVQPDFQYVIRPGGGILDPNNAARRVGDEAVFGLRTNITF